MSLSQTLLAELKYEATNTKKVLERVSIEHFDWKPHDKSFSLGGLAGHITELPSWVSSTVNANELDLSAMNYKPPAISNSSELMQSFQDHIEKASCVLRGDVKDEHLMKNWTLRKGDHIIFTLPRINVLRTMVFNHIVHHRAQLTVYLRLLDIPVPSIYGPSADEPF